jgi:hypothetical protein
MDRFDELSQELESSISDAPASETDAVAKAKKKGRNQSDLTADQVSGAGVDDIIDEDDDPAEKPVKSGGNYPDTKKYIKKASKCAEPDGDEDDDDEDDDDEDDDDEDDKKPAFFGKKNVKKAVSETEEVDATEFMTNLGNAVDYLGGQVQTLTKSMKMLMKGQAIFGNIVADLADPRKDKLQETMAKALVFLVKENKDLKKSVINNNDLMKSVSKMPGVPFMAGMVNPNTGETLQKGAELSKADADALQSAVLSNKITKSQWLQARHTGDLSCLKK